MTTPAAKKYASLTLLVLSSCLFLPKSMAGQHNPVDPFFETLNTQSIALSQVEYKPPVAFPALAALSYDDLGAIQFKPDRTFFQDQRSYGLQLFQLGGFNVDAIDVHVLNKNGSDYLIHYDKGYFTWPKKILSSVSIPNKTGFSGFRLLTPPDKNLGKNLSKNPSKDSNPTEFMVFQGASYFRARGLDGWYGQSARGIAIDTVQGVEEFPLFRDYDILSPAPGDKTVTVYALLDGPSITGAFRFIIKAGSKGNPATTMDVYCQMHARKDIKRIGIAPLTSMFWHGEINKTDQGDYRPEVHDTDGLLINEADNQWLWRPLSNPGPLLDNAFMLNNPKGFGLMQRDRNWSHYQDVGAMYDKRSNAWVQPIGEWGSGRISLIQIPTDNEYADNIVAFWTPKKEIKAHDSLSYHYKITWSNQEPKEIGQKNIDRDPSSRGSSKDSVSPLEVQSTRIAKGDVFSGSVASRFVIDFKASKENLCKGGLTGDALDSSVEPIITTTGGEVVEKHTNCLPDGGWRIAFNLKTLGSPVDLTARLVRKNENISEVWSYTFYPEYERR